MQSRITNHPEQIDSATSRTICRAVGDRLRRDLGPDVTGLPLPLMKLLDEMRRQEASAADRAHAADPDTRFTR